MAYSWKDNLPDGGAIPENSAGDPLATLTADDGTTDAVSYGIGDGSDGYGKYLFEIDNNGVLSPKTMPADYLDDYEDSILVQYRADRLFTATVNAYSAEGEVVASRLFVLTLQDVNDVNWVENPAIYGGNGTIAENTDPATALATFNATDDDASATVTYSLDSSATDATFFNIDASTGILTAKSAFNFEHASHDNSYHIRVIANSDDASLSVTQDFRITITNVDEQVEWQTAPTGNAGEVLENMAIGTSVANFGATDPEGGVAYYGLGSDYGFDGGHQDAYFNLNLQTGELTTKSELNFEEEGITNGHYTILALSQAGDGHKGVISELFILTLTNIENEELEWVGTPSTATSIAENDSTAKTIGIFAASDTDNNSLLTYSLATGGADNSYFSINAETGELSTTGAFDFEDSAHANGLYTAIVNATATEGSTPVLSRRYVLTITDVDERIEWQTTPTGNAGEVLENIAIDTVLATFVSTDPEGAESYYGVGDDYGFVGGHQDSYFSLDLYTGELTTKAELDYEKFTHYTILALSQARDKDLGVGVISELFVLTLTDQDIEWQSGVAPTGNAIDENNPATTSLADFGASDTDGATITYSLATGGADNSYFAIDAETGELSTSSSFNFEDSHDPRYSVVVIATDDADGDAISTLYVLTVTDVGDEPAQWQTGGNPTGNAGEVLENIAIGTSVADFGATDPEGAGTAYYGLGSDYNFDGGHQDKYFSINLYTGELTTKSVLDFEDGNAGHYTILLLSQAAEGNKGVAEHIFILTLTNIENEFTTGWQDNGNPNSATLAENNAIGESLADFAATDGDGVAVTYSLSGNDNVYFNINATTGVLTANSIFDFENINHGMLYSVVVNANSTDGSATTQLFVLSIGNENEFDTSWQTNGNPTGNTLAENNFIGATLADFNATDLDGVAATYSLRGNRFDDDYFAINATTGVLTANSIFDFENKDHYTVEVLAISTDGGVSLNQTFVLTLTDIENEFTTGWQDNGNPNSATLVENNSIGATTLADFNATDGDGVAVTYSLSGNDNVYFNIDATTGVLTANSIFDFENINHGMLYSVVVNANSLDGSDTITQLFVLSITNDVSEASLYWYYTVSDGESIDENLTPDSGGLDIFRAETDGSGDITYGLLGKDADYFNIAIRQSRFYSNTYDLHFNSAFDYESEYGQSVNNRYSVVIVANSTESDSALTKLFILTINDVDEERIYWRDEYRTPDDGAERYENIIPDILILYGGSSPYYDFAGNIADFRAWRYDGSEDTNITYGLSGKDASYFNIVYNDSFGHSELYFNSAFDYESDYGQSINNRYSVVIIANSTEDDIALTHLFILTINDVVNNNTIEWYSDIATGSDINENITPHYKSELENLVNRQWIAKLGYRVDVTYGLSGDSASFFTIADHPFSDTIDIFNFKSAFDYESDYGQSINNRYSVVITANTNEDGIAISWTYILTINDVNAYTTGWENNGNPSGATFAENNSIGAAIADFNATDGDGDDGVAVTYSLRKNYLDDDYFAINATTGVLTANSIFDFENPDNDDNRYTVAVRARSTDDSASLTQTFILTITDVDESQTPTGSVTWDIAPSDGIRMNENDSPRYFEFFTAEIDGSTDNITYGLSGDSASYFNLSNLYSNNPYGDYALNFHSAFDYESEYGQSVNNRYSIVITANSTADDNALTHLFVITIKDIAEATTWENNGNPSGNTLEENNTIGASIADFNATDGDTVAVTYSLASGNDNAYFNINATTGVLTAKSAFDFETQEYYSVVVNANSVDDSNLITQTFVLTITDENEPTAWQNNGNPSGAVLAENNSIGTSLADFGATDGDGVAVTYGLSGNDTAYFNINATTGVLSAKSAFDFEDTNHGTIYSVVVNATSLDGSASINQQFILTITDDVSDNAVVNQPTNWQNNGNPSGAVLAENNSIGTSLADFGATDGDGVAVTYGLSGNDTAYFNINATTGVLTSKSSFNFEDGNHSDGLYSVVVNANSTDGSAATQLFVLTITDVDENQTPTVPITWERNSVPSDGRDIAENQSPDTFPLLEVFGAEIDGSSSNITYGLSGKDVDHFNIYDTGFGFGFLRFNSVFDYESDYGQSVNNRYSVVIVANSTADDNALTQLFVLTINDDERDNNQTPGPITWIDAPFYGGDLDEKETPNDYGYLDYFLAETDGSGNITYGLSGTDASYFNIAAKTGSDGYELHFNSAFDYKSDYGQSVNNRYSIVITANSTEDDNALTTLFVLTINDVEETITWERNYVPVDGDDIDENRTPGFQSLQPLRAETNGSGDITYGLSGDDASYFTIAFDNFFERYELHYNSAFDYESDYGQSINNRYSVVIIANSTEDDNALTHLFVLTINDVVSGGSVAWTTAPFDGVDLDENQTPDNGRLDFFRARTDGSGDNISYGISGKDADYFNISTNSDGNGELDVKSAFDYESTYGQSVNNRYSVVITASSTEGDSAITQTFVLTINDVDDDGGLAPDPTTPDQPVGWNGKILFDGDTDNLGGISDGIGNDGLAIIGNNLSVTQYDSVSATNTDLVLNNIENFETSFVGYTDADGNEQNHWFFVRDDATDDTGHIVFDADGLDVNLESLANGGATTTPDQINLLAGLNFNNDGDFNKPDDLDLNLNNNSASALTHDQFLALIGGSNNIDFV